VRVDWWAYSGVDAPGKYENQLDGHDRQVNRGPGAPSNRCEPRESEDTARTLPRATGGAYRER
jgi:hypothetical protein